MSDFKSKIDWPSGGGGNLMRRDGKHPGKNSERTAVAKAGGTEGIRRVDWTDAQGNSYIMNTRAGYPRVLSSSKDAGGAGGFTDTVRGFVAHVETLSYAAQFSPYSLEVNDPNYTMFGHKYTVLPFHTSWNTESPDALKWFDVLSFFRGRVIVNGKNMTALLKVSTAPNKALPWLIQNTGTDVDKYGDAVINAYTKRLFAIHPDKVYSWANSGISAELNNPSARPNKALMCGPRLIPAADKAFIAQLAFTGEVWDSASGGWAFTAAEVSMLLASPYLTKVDYGISAERSLCIPTSTGPSSGTERLPHIFPPCQVGLMTDHGTITTFPDPSNYAWVRFFMDQAWMGTPEGYELSSYGRMTYSGGVSESVGIGLETLTVTASNTYYNGTELSLLGMDDQYSPTDTGASVTPHNGGSTLVFADNLLFAPTGPWGAPHWGVQGDVFGDYPAEWLSRRTNGSFDIRLSTGEVLVGGSFSRYVASGQEYKLEMRDWASDYTSGGGSGSLYYYGPGYEVGAVPAELLPVARARMRDAANAWAGTMAYDNGNAALGYGNFGDRSLRKYAYYLGTRSNVDNRTLNWTTKDYILYDRANSCFISIDSVFAGAQAYGSSGTGALTVNLTIITPLGTVVSTLFTTAISYGDILPEYHLEYSYNYVPNPKQRAIFAPLFQEQGDFKGAAYTSAAEVANGATSAYLFNFVLTLDTYYAIGEDTTAYPTVNFIPCNLLEMLYAYVYSSQYGVDPNGTLQRYPVSRPDVYAAFQATLFSNQWRVNYRDGTLVDWLDTLGTVYVDATTTELYRV